MLYSGLDLLLLVPLCPSNYPSLLLRNDVVNDVINDTNDDVIDDVSDDVSYDVSDDVPLNDDVEFVNQHDGEPGRRHPQHAFVVSVEIDKFDDVKLASQSKKR